MIVKVPPTRQDGGSSFKDLEAYITEGIEQASENTKAASWDRLTQYIVKENVLNALGENVEKTIGVEIGNVTSLDLAAGEMRAIATRNSRATNPTLHYILSWPEGEVPENGKIFDAARSTLKALGMEDHQYIIAIHGNTDNIHAHIAVNRVHPVTYKAARIEWLHKTLHKAAREIEIEHGWSHDNGLFKVVEINGKKHVLPNNEYVDPDIAETKGTAKVFETWSGEESLETWAKGEPAKALKAVLADDSTSSWQDVHRVLANYGLELRDSGGGGMRLHALDDAADGPADRKAVSVSASKAFRFLKRPQLEARFGPFEQSQEIFSNLTPEKTYKRDPAKRLDRKLERKALRDALHKRFSEEQRAARLRHDLKKQEWAKTTTPVSARQAAIDGRYALQRAAIKADPTLPAPQKRIAYMLAKSFVNQERLKLKEQIANERAIKRALLDPLPTWREWVEAQALAGDEAAVSALRGMVYQERRDGKTSEADAIKEITENAIRPASPSITDPLVVKMPMLAWQVQRNGTVAYNFRSGDKGFIDAGEKLVFGRALVSDEALAVTLQYAKEKWGGELRITGGDKAFQARVAHMANKLGIDLKNPDLKALQASMQAQAPKPAPKKAVPAVSVTTPAPASTPVDQPGRSIEAIVLQMNPNAQIEHAITQSKRYTGKIVAKSDRHFAQQTAKDKYVLHDKSLFKTEMPAMNDRATVSYQSGKPSVSIRSDKGRA